MMDIAKITQAIATIDELLKEVGAARDKIDERMSELEDIRDDCDGAYDLMQEARDRLSELV